ncbi:acetylxylan esterase [Actinopolymorpha pittospori]
MTGPRDPRRHSVTVHRPADFDEFWAATLERLKAVPLRPSFEYSESRSTAEVAVFDVRYDSFDGLRIAGWYAVPRPEYVPPPYPALMLLPGYMSEPVIPKAWARRGYAAFAVAPRGKLRSNERFNPGYPGLLVHNIVDPNTYSYRGFYVDAVRAVETVLTRPEVDPDRVGVHGSSQGGALTVTTAALLGDVVACGAAGAPYLCGFMDAARLTHSYPYEEINEYLRVHPDHERAVTESVGYFDGINFAPKIRVPMMVYLGMEDDVCPPETGFAVYDALDCPKELHTYDRCGHDAGIFWEIEKVESFLAGHLKPAVPTPSGDTTAVTSGVTAGVTSGTALSVAADQASTPEVTDGEFEAYWARVDAELAASKARPVIDLVPSRSTDDFTGYEIRISSLGDYRLFGYLSVPKGEGPFPGILATPNHGSVNNPPHYEDRLRYVMLTIMHRGQRLADSPFAASYPGLLTEGIESEQTYVYRGIVADCLRGAEFLAGQPSVDPARLAVVGDDLAVLTAARRPVFSAVEVGGALLYQAAARESDPGYPLEELNDHLRARPDTADALARTLAFFDAGRHAAAVRADVRVSVPPEEPTAQSGRLARLAADLGSGTTRYVLTHEGQTDADAADRWLAERLGVPASSKFDRQRA